MCLHAFHVFARAGFQQTAVVCMKRDTRVIVIEENCNANTRPASTSVECNTHPCEARYVRTYPAPHTLPTHTLPHTPPTHTTHTHTPQHPHTSHTHHHFIHYFSPTALAPPPHQKGLLLILTVVSFVFGWKREKVHEYFCTNHSL